MIQIYPKMAEMIFLVKWQQELIHYQVLAENDQNSILCDPRKNKSMKLWEAALTHIIITSQTSLEDLGAATCKSFGSPLEVLWKSFGSSLEVLWKSFRSPLEVLQKSCRSPVQL